MSRYLLFVTQEYSFSILRPLSDAIKARGDEAAWFCHDISPSRLLPDDRLLTSVRQVLHYQPAAVFVPNNWVPHFFPGVKVQIFHGLGIDKKGHFRIRGLFDLYCTHGSLTTRPFQTLAKEHGHFAVVETGWPKLDPLFQAAAPRQPESKPVILYAPTFSPSLTSAPALLPEIVRLAKAGRWQWIVKFHPKMDAKTVAAYRKAENAHLTISDDTSILPLLHRADIMVSDTSSVVTESVLVGTPVATFRAENPGPHAPDFADPADMESMVERLLFRPADVMAALERHAAEMHPYRDGRSSERVLRAVDDFIASPPELRRKPLNLFRRLQIRKRLDYWRW